MIRQLDVHVLAEGTFRVVTFVRASLEPELAADPMVAQVGWSWLVPPNRWQFDARVIETTQALALNSQGK